MDSKGWNMNWQGLNQNPVGYQSVAGYTDGPGYPNGGPSYSDTVEDDQMHGMTDSLATLRPEPEPDEEMIAPETTIPGHMSYEGVQYPITESSQHPSQPSETTSQTSLNDLFHDYDAEPNQAAQQVFNAHDLVHVAGWNSTAPTIIDDIDLSDATGVQASQAPAVKIGVQPPDQMVHPEMMGLSNRDPPVTPPSQVLQEHLHHVNIHHRKLFTQGEAVLALEDLLQTQQSLGHLISNVDALIQERERITANNPSISTPSSVGKPQQMYQCIQCLRESKPASIFYNTGSFKRHVNEQHYPQFEYHCPLGQCHEIRFRRSKIKDHITNTHKQIPRPKAIDFNTHERPVEPVCKLCPKAVRTWKEFYNCFMSHCAVQSPPTSRRSSDDRGSAIEASGSGSNTNASLGQTHANTPPPQSAPPAYSSYGSDGNYDHSLAPQGVNSGQGYHLPVPAPMSRSVSDDVVRGPASTNASPTRLQRHNPLARRNISGNSLPRTIPGHRPQLPRSALRNSASQSSGLAAPSCRGCGRLFDDCNFCHVQRNSGGTCCRCHSPSSAVQAPRAGSSQGQPMRYISPAMGTSEPQMQSHLMQQGLAGSPMYGAQQAPQPTAPNFQGSFDSQMALYMGTPSTPSRGGPHNVFAVTEVTEPLFDEVDMAYSMRESKMAGPVGSWISSLPMRFPLVQSVIKPLKQLSNSLYGGTCVASPVSLFPEPTHPSASPPPCNCPCRTAAKLQEAYSGHARAELAPGKRLKLDLKILSPENHGPGHHPSHLRTRVRLVVKLLKLRSSAAKTSGKKQEKETKQALEEALESTFRRSEEKVAEEADDSDESETDSIFDDTASMSTSCSDIDALVPATPHLSCQKDGCRDSEQGYEETTALSFDFDLDSTLYVLSRWSGGLSEDLCSDLAVMDPGSVFEFFFQYIIHVVIILSRSRGYGRASRFDRANDRHHPN